VAVGGAALAFVGQSGRGKSTLAALMCVDGAALVTDDVLTVDASDRAMCVGAAAELRLRPAAAPIADALPAAATRTTGDDRLALAADETVGGSVPLKAIVIPCPSRTATEVEVLTIPPSIAVFTMLAFPRVYGWTRRDVLTRDFDTLSRLVNLVPVYAVTIPWGPPFDPSVVRCLSRLLGESDSAESVSINDRRVTAAAR
jgi:hypothetical protein